MQRTEYFNETRPTDTQLNYTEDSKISSTIRRLKSLAQMGIVEGFRITVNGLDNTKVDIGAGEGYTGGTYLVNTFEGSGSAERISTTTDTVSGVVSVGNIIQNQALADYTLNSKNYISLVYQETTSHPLAERSFPFTAHDTVITESYSVSVLPEADWNGLSAAQLNSRFLVGIVTANGAGAALTTASIDQFVQPRTHPTASNPSNITGVTVVGLSQETLLGNGTLRYDPTSNSLYWTAPSDAEGGAVSIGSNGTYILYSNDVTYWIRLEVVLAALPGAAQTDTIQIRSLYGRTIPMFCAKDTAHRDMVGSGTPTVKNPHATTLDDIEGGTFDHADYFHLNGISKDADPTVLECVPDGFGERILINNPGGTHDKFLLDGLTYNVITGVAAPTPGEVNFNVVPLPPTGRYLIYLDSSATPQRVQIGEALWDANIRVVDIHTAAGGNATIAWDDAISTLTFAAPGDIAGNPVYVMYSGLFLGMPTGYYKVYSDNGTDWVIVHTNGLLGVTNSTTFSVTKNETNYPDETILKLSSVQWDSGTGALTDLYDIRRFVTADNRNETEEEHDVYGRHTNVIQSRLRVAQETVAIYAIAESNTAVWAYARENEGGRFGAGTATGVFGFAATTGVYGSAATLGVFGKAAAATGVYGSAAVNTGGMFYAGADYGVWARAIDATAVYATAASEGVYVKVAGATAGYFSAGGNTALQVIAVGDTGGRFEAPNYAVWGSAATSFGVRGLAANLAGYFQAVGDNGAADIIGVYGQAANAGAPARALGVHGYVAGAGATGVYGQAVGAAGFGMVGSASVVGVRGVGGAGTGVQGTGSSIGVAGHANAANGTGVYAEGVGGDAALAGNGFLEWAYPAGAAHPNSVEEWVILFNGSTRYIHLYT